jgi:hypothetical protein
MGINKRVSTDFSEVYSFCEGTSKYCNKLETARTRMRVEWDQSSALGELETE